MPAKSKPIEFAVTVSPIHLPQFEKTFAYKSQSECDRTTVAINVPPETYTLIWVPGLCGRKSDQAELRAFRIQIYSQTSYGHFRQKRKLRTKQRGSLEICIVN